MPRINVIVRSPNRKQDDKKKSVDWPVVPRVREHLDLASKGFTGVTAEVVDVQHWFGCDDIDIIAMLVDEDKQEAFDHLETMGWKSVS